MSSKTTNKIKQIGSRKYIDEKTGEVIEMGVVEVTTADAHFQKIWISHILDAVDELSSKKLKVVMHLVAQSAKYNNMIPTTVTKLAQDLEMSRPTVTEAIQILERNGIVRRQTGVIWVNPDVVFKGSRTGRMDVLMRYRSVATRKITTEEKIKKTEAELGRLQRHERALRTQLENLQDEAGAA